MRENKLPEVDYDTHWKEIIEGLFEDFIAFFLPEASPLIDFSRSPVFLEQELHEILSDNNKKGKKINDKLAKVYLKDGREKWILIHIEVQANREAKFSERMFTYFYRIYDRYKKEITATAIYIGDGVPKSFGRFEYKFLGTKTIYEYNNYIVANVKEEELLKSQNPFAIAILAMKYLHKTKIDGGQRFAFKRKLVELAMERHYSQHQIVKLFKFVLYILVLPKGLERKFKELVVKEKTSDDMYVEKSNEWSNLLHMAVYGRSLDDLLAEKAAQAAKIQQEAAVQAAKMQQEAQAAAVQAAKMQQEAQAAAAQAAKMQQEAAAQAQNQIKMMLALGKLSLEEIALLTSKTLEEIEQIAKGMAK